MDRVYNVFYTIAALQNGQSRPIQCLSYNNRVGQEFKNINTVQKLAVVLHHIVGYHAIKQTNAW